MKKRICRKITAFILSAAVLLGLTPMLSYAAATPSITVSSVRSSVIAPGVSQDVAVAHNADGGRVAYYVASADITRPDVNIYANYMNNQCRTWGMQKLSDQVLAAEANHSSEENYRVVASCNGAFYNMVTGRPIGVFVMDGTDITNPKDNIAIRAFFAILKDGTPVIANGNEYENYKGNIQEAVAGNNRLIQNGEIVANLNTTSYSSRTSIGIKANGEVVIMVADGKQAPVSVGLSNYEQALIMQSYGCKDAIELDGGGSSTYGCRPEGEDSFRVINTPSDGYDRSVANSLMIVSTAAPSGVFDHAVINSEYTCLTPNTSITLEAVGADSTSKPAPLPDNIEWTVSDSSLGSIEDGVFTAGENTGTVTVSVTSNNEIIGSIDLEIMYPNSLKFTKDPLSVTYGTVTKLPVAAYYDDLEVAISDGDIFGITGNIDALIERPDLYGYVDGLYYYAPEESCGIRCTSLHAIFAWSESEDDIVSLNIELRRENETVFDFNDLSGGNEEFAWKRTPSNVTVNTPNYYTINNSDESVDIDYTFAIDLRTLQMPEELMPLWDSFGETLGGNVWGAMLRLANKIDPETGIFISLQLDPNLSLKNLNEISFSSELFTLDRESIELDEETNTLKANCMWNTSFIRDAMIDGVIDPEAVNPISVLSNLKLTISDDAVWTGDELTPVITGSISYKLIAISSNVYKAATSDETLVKYAYYNEAEDKKGICFESTYKNFTDTFVISRGTLNGWIGDSYYVDGEAVKGQLLIDGVMYTFDENGIYQPDYLFTGFYKDSGGWMYFMDNEPLSGWVYIGQQWYYFKSDFYAATGTYQISGLDYKFEGEQGKSIGAWDGRRFYYCRTYYKNEWAVIEGESYYFDNNGYRYENGKYAVTYIGTFLGAYEFDADGKLVEPITGVFRDSSSGLYYYSENGVMFNGGIFEWNGDYYYAKTNYSLAVTSWYVSSDNANGYFPEGTYDFGTDGKMILFTGIKEENGILGYYIDNVQQFGSGLIRFNGDYYYVRSNGMVATTAWYVPAGSTNGWFPAGEYVFGSDGRMVTSADDLISLDSSVQTDNGNKFIIISAGRYNSLSGLVGVNDPYCTFETDSSVIATGSTVTVYRNGEAVNTYTIVLRGDVNGDGFCDGTDSVVISCISGGMLDENDIGRAFMTASDINADTSVDNLDVNAAIQAGLLA